MTCTAATRTTDSRPEPATPPRNPTIVSTGGLLLGPLLLIVAFANLNRMPRWADGHGTVPVYLGFFLCLSVAGRLTWWGIDTLRDQAKALRDLR